MYMLVLAYVCARCVLFACVLWVCVCLGVLVGGWVMCGVYVHVYVCTCVYHEQMCRTYLFFCTMARCLA